MGRNGWGSHGYKLNPGNLLYGKEDFVITGADSCSRYKTCRYRKSPNKPGRAVAMKNVPLLPLQQAFQHETQTFNPDNPDLHIRTRAEPFSPAIIPAIYYPVTENTVLISLLAKPYTS